eukprot:TRINITY_DN20059_c0_g1_i1.p1 TRINITY_DN20059_c0_g1~~TRINITY_DN20059_c0_g1_i1.p1  ORF type:complete len:372 (+),score=105.91 TRINITY_DN20059_c0_g1_i1:167-1282(+)
MEQSGATRSQRKSVEFKEGANNQSQTQLAINSSLPVITPTTFAGGSSGGKKRGHTRSKSLCEPSSKEQRMEEAKSQMDNFLSRAAGVRKLHLSSVVEAALQSQVIIPSPRGSSNNLHLSLSSGPGNVPGLDRSNSPQSNLSVPPPSPTHSPRGHKPLNFTPSQLTLVLQGEPVLLCTYLSNQTNQKFYIMVSAATTLGEISSLIREQVPSLWSVKKYSLKLEGVKWSGKKEDKLLSIDAVRARYMNEEEINVEVEILEMGKILEEENEKSKKEREKKVEVLASRMSGWQSRMWKLQSRMREYLEALDAEYDEILEGSEKLNKDGNSKPSEKQAQVERMIVMLQGLVEVSPIDPPDHENEEDQVATSLDSPH